MLRLVLYRDANGKTPLVDWLQALPTKAMERCLVRLDRLRQMGNALRRPEADYLEQGIYELRICSRGVNYRILYFFHGQTVVVVTQGFVKQQAAVPRGQIVLALRRRTHDLAEPDRHSHAEGQ